MTFRVSDARQSSSREDSVLSIGDVVSVQRRQRSGRVIAHAMPHDAIGLGDRKRLQEELRMPSTETSPSAAADQLTRALGEAVIRIWSDLPQEVQDHLFKGAVASRGESIRSQLAVFLHDKHPRTLDPLGNPRDMKEPDSLGG
jgi:hypothetical protein